ncbi:thiamine-monophosphate kinase [Luminiphilus syltensis NOR5-1B]|uniref:Thiamine-monophosphate kinase n=1 Tax=Luminiphilus syltensis NOR5-1B TaxID=565045 RepID=B8KWB4_9GAMM|nr:thiamine-phosphate kinase [Luminiphilus syltensis]EED36983.1 thiamine-monophosphate kinase [Luminiphilus syltensis NOR5-1B]
MATAEFELIGRYFASLGGGDRIALGIGDDAAVFDVPEGEQCVVSTDTQVEYVHFFPETLPEDIAYRAVAAAASDLAAMGASPLGMTLALTLPEADELWLHGFSQGLAAAVRDLALPLMGGDTTQGPLTITITVHGSVPRDAAVTRGGARPGDRLCVTGTLGDAAAALALQRGELSGDRLPEAEDVEWLLSRFNRPIARFEWLSFLRAHGSAAIDISDGLLADAEHIAAASGVALTIDSTAIPLSDALRRAAPSEARLFEWALGGGDDYELLCTVPAGCQIPDGLAVIGEVVVGQGVQIDRPTSGAGGYAHFN